MSMAIYQYLISKMMENNVSILAVLDNEEVKPEIVGLQILSIASKDDPSLPEVYNLNHKPCLKKVISKSVVIFRYRYLVKP